MFLKQISSWKWKTDVQSISEWLIVYGHIQPSHFVKSSFGMSFDKKQAKCKLTPLESNSTACSRWTVSLIKASLPGILQALSNQVPKKPSNTTIKLIFLLELLRNKSLRNHLRFKEKTLLSNTHKISSRSKEMKLIYSHTEK